MNNTKENGYYEDIDQDHRSAGRTRDGAQPHSAALLADGRTVFEGESGVAGDIRGAVS